jgi:hypothetical protein
MAKKAKLVFRGARRQVLRKLERAIELLDNMDFREAERSIIDGRTGDFFYDSATIRTSVQRVKNQATELLAYKR